MQATQGDRRGNNHLPAAGYRPGVFLFQLPLRPLLDKLDCPHGGDGSLDAWRIGDMALGWYRAVTVLHFD
jgi:hypothetical protein